MAAAPHPPVAVYSEPPMEKAIRVILIPFIVYCLATSTIGLNIDTASILGMVFIYLYLAAKRRIMMAESAKAQRAAADAADAANQQRRRGRR